MDHQALPSVRRAAAVLLLLLAALLFTAPRAEAQKAALQTNLLYGAMTAPNLALELRTGDHTTLDVGGGFSLWKWGETHTFKHWLLQPELRYWTCEPFNGHFFGLHLHGGQFNLGDLNLPIGRLKELRDHRYQGYLYGAGLSYGYQWILSRHWNLEASLGAGYARVIYEKFPCAVCGTKVDEGTYNYWGITRGSLSIVYVF